MLNKKIVSIIILCVLVCLCFACFASCQKGQDQIKIMLPDGTPALALANVLDNDAAFSDKKTTFKIVPAANIQTAFVKNNDNGADIALMPTVVAAKLYSNGQKIKMLSANVYGNLYVVGAGVSAPAPLSSLKGKVVYVTIGTTVTLFKYLLNQNNIPVEEGAEPVEGKVVLATKNDGSEIVPLLVKAAKSGQQAFAVLGEPQAAKATANIRQFADTAYVVDFQAEWKTLTGFEGYPQAGLFATEEFCKNNKTYIKKLLAALEKNSEFLTAKHAELPQLFARYDSNLKNLTFDLKTIENCNLKLVRAADAKKAVLDYIGRVMPAAVKDSINDAFFN